MTSTQFSMDTCDGVQSFPEKDVLQRPTQRLSRLASIFNALIRESSEPAPVRIEYMCNSKSEMMETRILASSDNGIILINKQHLPLSSIFKIQLL